VSLTIALEKYLTKNLKKRCTNVRLSSGCSSGRCHQYEEKQMSGKLQRFGQPVMSNMPICKGMIVGLLCDRSSG